MNALLKPAAFILVLVMSVSSASANELEIRYDIELAVRYRVLNEEFATLEETASDFRDNDARTSSGLRKLFLFYHSFGDAAEFSLRYVHDDEQPIMAIANAWVDTFPQSPTAILARAAIQRKIAWYHRLNGDAQSSRQDRYRTFVRAIKAVDASLREAEDYASVDSYYYYMRAHNLNETGASPEDFLALLHEGLDKFPDAYQLHFAGVDYFAPKWHGSAELIEAYARRAIQYSAQTDPDALYARIYWYAAQTQYGLNLFSNSDVVWSDMRRGIDKVLLEFPDQWNIQNFAVFACAADDAELTRTLFARVEEPILSYYLQQPQIMEHCRDIANL